MPQQTARQDMQLLHEVEYGVLRELVFRLVGVMLGSVLMFLYTGWLLPFAWCLGYLVTHAMHYRFIVTHLERPTPRDLTVAGLLYLVVVLAFMWWPTYLGMQSDPAMIYVGVTLVTSTLVYQIRRGDRILWLNWAQIVIFATMISLILWAQMPNIPTPLGKIGAVLVTLAAFAYVALAMLYARRTRMALEETAQRLAQDQKMSAIGRLAGGIAHDFNNMLTVVKGNLELYHLIEDPEERRAAVIEAQTAAQRAEDVVHHLMVYARKAPVRRQLLDANAAVAEVMTLIRSVVPSRIRCTLHTAPGRLPLEVDQGQLTTALLNLVKNAVDATEGPGCLRIETAVRETTTQLRAHNGVELAAGRYVTVAVRDTGAGIDPDHLARLSEPFFTTKPVGKGTGLGLSMVAGFVQGSGGGLSIDSDSNGTTVMLWLPALALPEAPQVIVQSPPEAMQPDGPQVQPGE